MKKILFFVLTGSIAVLGSAFVGNQIRAGTRVNPIENFTVVSLSEVNKSLLEDFFGGKIPNTILKCPQGVNLPMNIILRGEFLNLEQTGHPVGILKITKTCFIRNTGNTFLFSTDQNIWKEFLEFFTGELGMALSDNGAEATLNIILNERK